MNVSSRFDGSICGVIFQSRASFMGLSAAIDVGHRRLRAPPTRNHFHAAEACQFCRYTSRSRVCLRRRPLLNAPTLGKIGLHDGNFFRPSVSTVCGNDATKARVRATSCQDNLPLPSDDEAELEDGPRLKVPPRPRTEAALLALVDQLVDDTIEDHLELWRNPFRGIYAQADRPRLVVSNRKEEAEYPLAHEVIQPDEGERDTLWQLRFAIVSRQRSMQSTDLDNIYDLYRQVPEPRMSYLNGRLRHALLRVLGQPLQRNTKSMLRYFSVIADVKNSSLSITQGEWNAAMSFASRYVGRSSEVEVESALRLWREMEQDAQIKATDLTFNILFDVASKAGNFTLAEMIYREMEARGHHFNRYHYTSLIHFFGLKRDAGGVRAAYREMVKAGEIIDKVVLNCVIAGLLRSGEEEAAERVYERMKDLDHAATDLPVRDYATNKAITKVLIMFARLGRRNRPMLEHVRGADAVPALLTPDLHTYRILTNHYVRMGDLGRVARYLDEMKLFRVPVHGAIFLALFKGFHSHGGYPGSAWSLLRLEAIWAALLRALDEGARGLEIRTWLAKWVLKAFARCSGNEERLLDAYEDMRSRWSLESEDEKLLLEELRDLLRTRLRRPRLV